MSTAVDAKRVVDLGAVADFRCGDLAVEPAARRIAGPGGDAMLEPRMMQLLVALAEASGAVVTRERLVARCWGNVVVGDDSLNRAIAGLRRGLKATGCRTVEVETVPKVGYRLVTADAGHPAAPPAGPDRAAEGHGADVFAAASRRRLLGTLGATAFGLGMLGAGGWQLMRHQRAAALDEELSRAERILLQGGYGAEGKARAILEPVATTAPDKARSWGLLAIAWQRRASAAVAEMLPEAEQQARDAAARAMALDRLQGDAQAALALLEPTFGAWLAKDERLQGVLEVAPDNGFAEQGTVNLLMAVGRMRDARALAEAAGAAHPDSALVRTARVQLAWTEAGPDAALRLSEKLDTPSIRVGLMPWLLAMTGRHAEAEAMIAGIEARQRAPSRILAAQRLTSRALGTGTEESRGAAREALLPLGAVGGEANHLAIGGLAGLGFVDDAFAAADGWYAGAQTDGDSPAARARRHRTSTRILFLPITEAMRADDRFVPLCERIGLVDYWRQRALRADALADRLLPL